jgi:hypothetical protein
MFCASLKKGSNTAARRKQNTTEGHMVINRLAKDGKLLVAGPCMEQNDWGL